MFEV
jgi:hypothetical protein